jgi:DNA-binding response OmpR family regulator
MRLLVIEDELDFAQPLIHGLCQLGYAVDLAADGEEGWHLAAIHDYDLIILDLNLPEIDGLTICRQLREAQSQVLILMLTARAQPADRIRGLDLGADDYLVKPFHFGELAARVRALLRRSLRIPEPVIKRGPITLDPASSTVWQEKRRLELTRKEFGILEYLMRYPGEVISQEELLEHVWNREANPFSNTIRTHITSLRRKLNDNPDCPRFIETVIGKGYRFLMAEQTQDESK